MSSVLTSRHTSKTYEFYSVSNPFDWNCNHLLQALKTFLPFWDEPDDFYMNAPKNETPTNNLSEGETDLMEIDLLESVTPLLNEDLAVNVQQVSLISEESGSATNPIPQ
jgi:hypothetical protein